MYDLLIRKQIYVLVVFCRLLVYNGNYNAGDWGNGMSLVQGFIYKDFILVAGDQKAILTNGQILENFVKVRKINPTTIIGMTGTIEANYKLFSQYINADLSLKYERCPQGYNEIHNTVLDSFTKNIDYLKETGIHSFICGWDEHKMTGTAFFTKDDNPDMESINDLTPLYPEHVRFISCGLDQHRINAEKIASNMNPCNILQFKTFFKKVISQGGTF